MTNSDISNHLSKTGEIRFGTDGWRAVIGDMFTIENLKIIAQAISDHLCKSTGNSASVAVGYDTRFMSEEFAGIVAEILAANKINVLLSRDVIPTPIVSFTVKHHRLDAGIVLTSSHNPFFYHGLKFKSPFGGPASIEMTARIEYYLHNRRPCTSGSHTGTYKEVTDFFPDYKQHVMNLLNMDHLSRYKNTIYFDPMYGAGQGILQKLLSDVHLRIESLHSERNPMFGGLYPEPIPYNLAELKKMITEHPGNIGIATDGDADRFGVLDHRGNYVAVHELLALLFNYLWDVRTWRGQVVRSTSLVGSVDSLAAKRGAEVQEVPVGFKHIAEEMISSSTIIGAEESGGFGYGMHIPERDGLLSSLLLIELLGYYESDIVQLITELRREIGTKAYNRIDFYYPTALLQERMESLKRKAPDRFGHYKIDSTDEKDGLKFYFKNGGWMLIRVSATEPMGRIYATGPTDKVVQDLLSIGRKLMTED